jgi:hypothetical protein
VMPGTRSAAVNAATASVKIEKSTADIFLGG